MALGTVLLALGMVLLLSEWLGTAGACFLCQSSALCEMGPISADRITKNWNLSMNIYRQAGAEKPTEGGDEVAAARLCPGGDGAPLGKPPHRLSFKPLYLSGLFEPETRVHP